MTGKIKASLIKSGLIEMPKTDNLPDVPSTPKQLGPSVLLLALGMGSGEFLVWPTLMTKHGFIVIFVAFIGVMFQFFVNLEIIRYPLATGETVMTGFRRVSLTLFVFMILANILPWIWPAWATGAAQCFDLILGGSGNHVMIATVGLMVAVSVLTLGKSVYRTAMKVQTTMIGISFTGAALLSIAAFFVDSNSLSLADYSFSNLDIFLIASGIAFAGAGGTLNLAHSDQIRDADYGMGKAVPQLVASISTKTSSYQTGAIFEVNEENKLKWRRWLTYAEREHRWTFLIFTMMGMALFGWVSFCFYIPNGEGLIASVATGIEEKLGAWGKYLYLIVGALIFFTSEIGIIDNTSRITSESLKTLGFSQSRDLLYTVSVVVLGATGILILVTGLATQTLSLVKIAGSLNIISMAVYSFALLYLNRHFLNPELRPTGKSKVIILIAGTFYLFLSVLTIQRFLL